MAGLTAKQRRNISIVDHIHAIMRYNQELPLAQVKASCLQVLGAHPYAVTMLLQPYIDLEHYEIVTKGNKPYLVNLNFDPEPDTKKAKEEANAILEVNK